MSLLQINQLRVTFETPDGAIEAVRGISLDIAAGECLGIVGESGSGKSQTFLAAFGLLPQNGRANGSVMFDGKEILNARRHTLNSLRGRKVAMVFQDPLTALTPHLRIEEQMGEVLSQHFGLRGEAARQKSVQWLEKVRIPEASRRLRAYPHELSGGMRQRVMIAMAMMAEPALLIADEPTTALDATVQAQVLDLMEDLRRETNTAVALITHDMGVIARMAQRVIVMRKGEIVETGDVDRLFSAPSHDYTKMLLAAVPRITGARAGADLAPPTAGTPLIEVENLKVHFPIHIEGGLFGHTKQLRAVDGVSFSLLSGETLGIVGESGCGKSTLARAVLQLLPRTAGSVGFLGAGLNAGDKKAIREARSDLQIVFQDPLASLDPRMSIGASIGEPLRGFRPELNRLQRDDMVRQMMTQVGLDPALLNRYPHELSGGQNQRVGIARAMILKPKFVVCDEAVSALDVSIQAQIVRLLIKLQKDLGLTMLFISHDLAVVKEISHRVMVLYLGRAVELGPADVILKNPQHPYTRALLAAAPEPDPVIARSKERVRLDGDLPSPLDRRATLRFMKSKLIDDADAEQYQPQMMEAAPGHWVAEYDPA